MCVCVYVCDDVVGVGVGVGVGLAGMFLTPPLPTSPSPPVNLESSMWISGYSAAPLFDRTHRVPQGIYDYVFKQFTFTAL